MLLFGTRTEGMRDTYVKLPALEVLASIFASYHHHELRDLAPNHPLVQLAHDLLDICFDLVIRGDQHCEAIFFYSARSS